MKPILEISSIGKKFRINHQSGNYLSLREQMMDFFRGEKHAKEDFWALKDVSFAVSPGESVGIIGRNGAGKSTLLKILSRITPPSVGRFTTRGRIASLLEVGTGFHPELTGRENVFLNGSLLGMRRREIELKFDEIVDFSGVEKFLDTPLKHFSNGMQLRLAFAVAAFLEPEILIIDEVLAVGDADFQAKCLGKMEDVHSSGRTILFVSHNLDAVESLCQRCIWIHGGEIRGTGAARDVVKDYLATAEQIAFQRQRLSENITLEKIFFPNTSVSPGESLEFTIELLKEEDAIMSDFALLFFNYKKQRVAIYDMRPHLHSLNNRAHKLLYQGKIQRFSLVEGDYYVGLYFADSANRGDFLDLAKIKVRESFQASGVKPYDIQYRGFVDLK